MVTREQLEVGKHYQNISSGEVYFITAIGNINARAEKIDKFPLTIAYKRVSDDTLWMLPFYIWKDMYNPLES